MAGAKPKRRTRKADRNTVTEDKEQKTWSFLGLFRIKRTTDILAFAAFIIAITTAFYQGYTFFRGADLIVYPSSYVLLVAHQYSQDEIFVRVGLPMNYSNQGTAGHDAAIKTEFVEFSLGGKRYRQDWQAIVFFTSRPNPDDCDRQQNVMTMEKLKAKKLALTGWAATNDAKDLIYNCQNKDDPKLIVKDKNEPLAAVVKAGGAVGHETYFQPTKKRCVKKPWTKKKCPKYGNDLPWDSFVTTIKRGDKVEFEMGVESFDGKRVSKRCVIDISQPDITWLKRSGWRQFDCWEIP